MDAIRWQIKPVFTKDKIAVIDLFNQVFVPNKMTEALWEWKYGQGKGLGFAAWRDDSMIAHYGGIMREMRYFGEKKLAVQITDVMVLPSERAVFTKHGAFFHVTSTFLDHHIGYNATTWIGYGFPSYRHVKLAQRLGLYAPVGEVVELRWSPMPQKPHLWTRIRHLQADETESEKIINQLWKNMHLSLQNSLVSIRDYSYISHRYYNHPHHHYEVLLLTHRFTGQALAIVVIKREEQHCKIMDFIGDIRHISEVIQQVKRLAANWHLAQVNLWISKNFVSLFPHAEQHNLDIFIPHNIWSPCFPPEQIQDKWWLMAGDTDFL